MNEDGLTIGQTAAFAGVTVKAIRHYHRQGLLDEPERDHSGYRRYTSNDLLRLVQVRTLAEAGAPLADISSILAGDSDQFEQAIGQVDRLLEERIAELRRRQSALHRLTEGKRLLVPPRAAMLLDRMLECGLGPEYVNYQQEAIVLMRAVVPEVLNTFLDHMERQLSDSDHVELLKQSMEIDGASDERIEELATALAGKLLDSPELLTVPVEFRERPDALARYAVVNYHDVPEGSAAARLTKSIEAKLRSAGFEL